MPVHANTGGVIVNRERELPKLTHLQFLVVAQLLDGERSGRQMRSDLAAEGLEKSGPGFYQMMARMEESGLVEGWYGQAQIGDQDVTERRYRLANKGRKLWGSTLRFYLRYASRSEAKEVTTASH